MEDDLSFQNRRRAIRHFIGWIILGTSVERIRLTQADTEDVRHLENIFLVVEFLQIRREHHRETVGGIRRRYELTLRILHRERALRGLGAMEKP